jgi:3-phosphoshikimate 1-carboxyvinyltransferase
MSGMGLKGSFTPPGDKSISHRVGLFSLLARGGCLVENYSPCADCASTLAAVKLLGGQADFNGQGLMLTGIDGRLKSQAQAHNVDCGNSGTTMRLLMGLLAGSPGPYVLDGDASLRRRPMERVATPLRLMGAAVDCTEGKPPVSIAGGGLTGITYDLPVASAQLKSALLLAGVRAAGETAVSEPAQSRDHTELLLKALGADIRREGGYWRVRRSALTLPDRLRVPGDASSAAFFLCAAAVMPASDVIAEGVLLNPTRTGFLEVLRRMGAQVEVIEQGREPEPWGRVRVVHGPELKGCEISGREIPLLVDEVPILALTASQAQGTTVFKDAGELRIKETDRLAAVAGQLGAMGADITVQGDNLVIVGPTPLRAAPGLDSLGDHRIAMTLRLALGLALGLAGADAPIADEGCAAVSYPGFSRDLGMLLP